MSEVETETPVAVEEVAVPKTKKARKKAVKAAAAEPEVEAPAPTKKGRKKAAAVKAAEPVKTAEPVKGDKSTKMTDTQKTDLKAHMMATADGMTIKEVRSMRMKLMSRMRKGMTLAEAKKDIA